MTGPGPFGDNMGTTGNKPIEQGKQCQQNIEKTKKEQQRLDALSKPTTSFQDKLKNLDTQKSFNDNNYRPGISDQQPQSRLNSDRNKRNHDSSDKSNTKDHITLKDKLNNLDNQKSFKDNNYRSDISEQQPQSRFSSDKSNRNHDSKDHATLKDQLKNLDHQKIFKDNNYRLGISDQQPQYPWDSDQNKGKQDSSDKSNTKDHITPEDKFLQDKLKHFLGMNEQNKGKQDASDKSNTKDNITPEDKLLQDQLKNFLGMNDQQPQSKQTEEQAKVLNPLKDSDLLREQTKSSLHDDQFPTSEKEVEKFIQEISNETLKRMGYQSQGVEDKSQQIQGSIIDLSRPSGYQDIDSPIKALAKEEVDRIFIETWDNSKLVEEAKKKDIYLRSHSEDLGSEVQSEIAKTLVLMFQEMDKRLQELPQKFDQNGIILPPEGTQWSSEEFAGIVEGIDPFQMCDSFWKPLIKKSPTVTSTDYKQKVTKIEFEEELIEVDNTPQKKKPNDFPHYSDEKLINVAIKETQKSNLNKNEKDRCVRLLTILRNPSADDRVLKVNEYLWTYGGKKVGNPDKHTHHIRPQIIDAMRRGKDTKNFPDIIDTQMRYIHTSYSRAALIEVGPNLGGGSASSRAEKAAHDWVAERMRDKNSIYHCWAERKRLLD